MSDILRTPMIQRLVSRVESACVALTTPSESALFRAMADFAEMTSRAVVALERIASALEAQNIAADPPENPYDRVVLGLLRREPGVKWSTGAIHGQIPDADKEALGLSLRDLEIRGAIHYDNGWFVYQEATDQEAP